MHEIAKAVVVMLTHKNSDSGKEKVTRKNDMA
jgi:hypothetical protein